jgi:plasmid stabilization system protein ParE
MKFTVVYAPEAERQLMELWLDAAARRAVTAAADAIDEILASNPIEIGESRPEGMRILFVEPLAVIFRVQVEDRIVIVTEVWRFR